MTTFKKVLSESPFPSPNQEEDSEEEAKLKYERLSNGVTDILKNDAASCMTVHDKVKVIIPPPHARRGFSVSSPIISAKDFPLFMCAFERCHLQSWFSSLLLNLQRQPILFSPSSAFPLREVHQKPLLSFPLFIPTPTYFSLLSHLLNVDMFKRHTPLRDA